MESKIIPVEAVQPTTRTRRHQIWRSVEPFLYITPAFLVLFIILIYPLGYSFWLSFHDWTLYNFRTAIPFVAELHQAAH
jgi:cellobiose transport system permease protein